MVKKETLNVRAVLILREGFELTPPGFELAPISKKRKKFL